MGKTYRDLQNELLSKTKSFENLTKRVSDLKQEVTRNRVQQERLIIQYERVIKSWRKKYEELLHNGWKLLFIKIVMKFKRGGTAWNQYF